MTAAALSIRDATKSFGSVVGLDGVDLEVTSGEVVALLGDNGAGKSTLIKCLSGALRLDRGTIEMDGVPVSIHTPADARALGIETVYQDLALFDNLRPSDNFYAGRELAAPHWLPRSIRVLKRREMATTTKSTLERMNVTLDDHGVVGLMSGGQRQAVAVSRAAAFASRVVILDEPTAVLIVSHALDHVIEVADRAVIMRRGRKVGEVIPSAETHSQIVSLIVGGGA